MSNGYFQIDRRTPQTDLNLRKGLLPKILNQFCRTFCKSNDSSNKQKIAVNVVSLLFRFLKKFCFNQLCLNSNARTSFLSFEE